jgi:hypothetical protein
MHACPPHYSPPPPRFLPRTHTADLHAGRGRQRSQVCLAICGHLQSACEGNEAHICRGEGVDVAGGAGKAHDCRGKRGGKKGRVREFQGVRGWGGHTHTHTQTHTHTHTHTHGSVCGYVCLYQLGVGVRPVALLLNAHRNVHGSIRIGVPTTYNLCNPNHHKHPSTPPAFTLSSDGSAVSMENGRRASASLDCLSRTSFRTSGVVTTLSANDSRFSTPALEMRKLASTTALRGLAAVSLAFEEGLGAGIDLTVAAQSIAGVMKRQGTLGAADPWAVPEFTIASRQMIYACKGKTAGLASKTLARFLTAGVV